MLEPRPDYSLLGVKKCASHAQIGLPYGSISKFSTSIPTFFIFESPGGGGGGLHVPFQSNEYVSYDIV